MVRSYASQSTATTSKIIRMSRCWMLREWSRYWRAEHSWPSRRWSGNENSRTSTLNKLKLWANATLHALTPASQILPPVFHPLRTSSTHASLKSVTAKWITQWQSMTGSCRKTMQGVTRWRQWLKSLTSSPSPCRTRTVQKIRTRIMTMIMMTMMMNTIMVMTIVRRFIITTMKTRLRNQRSWETISTPTITGCRQCSLWTSPFSQTPAVSTSSGSSDQEQTTILKRIWRATYTIHVTWAARGTALPPHHSCHSPYCHPASATSASATTKRKLCQMSTVKRTAKTPV